MPSRSVALPLYSVEPELNTILFVLQNVRVDKSDKPYDDVRIINVDIS